MTDKPEILTLDLGKHNQGSDSATRIMQGGSWKKQRVIVLVPSANMIHAKVYLSHCSLIFPPNQPVYRMLCLGMEVGDAYSQAIDMILTHPDLKQWEYIVTLEHDNTVPPDGVLKLIESMEAHPEYDVISALYWTKGEGGVPQIWGDPADPVLNFRPQVPKVETVQECCGTGMGFALWRLSLFKDKKLRRPWFKTIAGQEGTGTQDLFFWGNARKYGHRCAVDTRVKSGHLDLQTGVVW